MKIKICGITDLNTAKKVCEYGADFIGFVFAKSKRQISVDEAKYICENIDSTIKKVGVFVDESPKDIIRIADYCKLDYIQLHGSETLRGYECKQKIIRSFSIDEDIDQKIVDEFEKLNKFYEHILFDTKVGKVEGGSGLKFDWEKIKDISMNDEKCFLAGGLNIKNVEDAIKHVKPYALDISSGVETNGKKDIEKIEKFIKLIRGV